MKNILIRPLSSDYHHGYLELLGNLTTVGRISEKDFEERVQRILKNPLYQIWIISVSGERFGKNDYRPST